MLTNNLRLPKRVLRTTLAYMSNHKSQIPSPEHKKRNPTLHHRKAPAPQRHSIKDDKKENTVHCQTPYVADKKECGALCWDMKMSAERICPSVLVACRRMTWLAGAKAKGEE